MPSSGIPADATSCSGDPMKTLFPKTFTKLIGRISHDLAANSPEAEAERKVSRLETKLSCSILSGDFSTVTAMRDEMDWMHIDDCR